jgi:hypothetical protein
MMHTCKLEICTSCVCVRRVLTDVQHVECVSEYTCSLSELFVKDRWHCNNEKKCENDCQEVAKRLSQRIFQGNPFVTLLTVVWTCFDVL